MVDGFEGRSNYRRNVRTLESFIDLRYAFCDGVGEEQQDDEKENKDAESNENERYKMDGREPIESMHSTVKNVKST